MREGELVQILAKHVKQCNGLLVPYVQGTHTISGWPDRYLCHRFWSGWLEFKRHSEKPDKLQVEMMRFINDRGDRGYFIELPYGNTTSGKCNIRDVNWDIVGSFLFHGIKMVNALALVQTPGS